VRLGFVVPDHGSVSPAPGFRARTRTSIGWKRRDDKSNDGKPFVYDELLARMRAVLRRSNGPRHSRLTVRDLEIDLASRVVTLAGEAVRLSAKEYELLVALAEDPERVFKKEELLRNVWGFRSLGRTRTLDSHASRLRRKLNAASDTAYVLNVWGVGYRLVATSS
jgi:DNA-binding response OmpR family regulator